MKLDLFYEFDAARPWDGPHPYGQRKREQKTYREAFEQIRLADELGYHTVWCVEQEQEKIFPFLQSVKAGDTPIAQYKASDTLIIGNPEDCYNKKMIKYVDLGVDDLLCYMQFGNLTNESVKRSLELIAREVMPEVEKYKAQKTAKETA